MMDMDYERVAALLAIVEKCAGHSGKLGAISNAAMNELLTLNDSVKAKATQDAKDAEVERQVEFPDAKEPEPKTNGEAETNGKPVRRV